MLTPMVRPCRNFKLSFCCPLPQVRFRMGESTPGNSLSCSVRCPHAVAPTVPAFMSSPRGHPVAVPLAGIPHHVWCVQLFTLLSLRYWGWDVGTCGGYLRECHLKYCYNCRRREDREGGRACAWLWRCPRVSFHAVGGVISPLSAWQRVQVMPSFDKPSHYRSRRHCLFAVHCSDPPSYTVG